MRFQPHVEDIEDVIEEKIELIVQLNQNNPYPPGSVIVLVSKEPSDSIPGEIFGSIRRMLPTFDSSRGYGEGSMVSFGQIGSSRSSQRTVATIAIHPSIVAPLPGYRARYYPEPEKLKRSIRLSIRNRIRRAIESSGSSISLTDSLMRINDSMNLVINNLTTLQNLPDVVGELGFEIFNHQKFEQLRSSIIDIEEKFANRDFMQENNTLIAVVRADSERKVKGIKSMLEQEAKENGFEKCFSLNPSPSIGGGRFYLYIWSDFPESMVKIFSTKSKTCIGPIMEYLKGYTLYHNTYPSLVNVYNRAQETVDRFNKCFDSLAYIHRTLKKHHLV